ncbi:MAG: winged helix-turn-helix domain-containing protein [Bryobacteraceae bacterium]
MEVVSNSNNTNVTGGLSPTIRESSRRIYRFGAFELRTQTGEFSKHGVRMKIQIKPLRVLEALLERPGELVSREELCSRLWASGTFVDFESGLNTATNRLRAALGDSAESPRYIETLPRLGYRFICPVSKVEEAESVPVTVTASQPPPVIASNLTSGSQSNSSAARFHAMRRSTQVVAIAVILFGFLFAVEYFRS